MKRILILPLILVACAKGVDTVTVPTPPEVPCTVEQVENGSLVTCGANSIVVVNPDEPNSEPVANTVVNIVDICSERNKAVITLSNGQVLVLDRRYFHKRLRGHKHGETCED